MKYEDRWYQLKGAKKLFKAVQKKDCHPVAAIPTAGGKTVVLCLFIDMVLSENPNSNILVLSHDQGILKQDYGSLRNFFEWNEETGELEDYSQIGLYSSGLNSKEIKKITVAGIQSIHRIPELFEHFDIVAIDEAHGINTKEVGMYRNFLSNLEANYAGLTATPYRTGYGYIYKGKGALFNNLCYDLTSVKNFNRLTDEGYLSKLYGKKTSLTLNLDKVKTVAGDFSQKDLSKNIDRDDITKKAVEEIIEFGANYKRWLIFAIDVEHANNIVREFIERGVSAIAIHSKLGKDSESREELVERTKTGEWKAVVNVNMLTTGHDDPSIDLIALMRPTKSPVLHVQMPGRGLRPLYKDGFNLNKIKGRLKAMAKGDKPHCLVLDFAGNFKRMGPINDIKIKQKGEKKGGGSAMMKDCPECKTLNHLSAKTCIFCEYEFPQMEKLLDTADGTSDVVKSVKDKKEESKWKEPETLQIKTIKYSVEKSGNPRSPIIFVLTYKCKNKFTFIEKIHLNGIGFAKNMAIHFLEKCWDNQYGSRPSSVEELMSCSHLLKVQKSVKVDFNGKHPIFLQRIFKKAKKPKKSKK